MAFRVKNIFRYPVKSMQGEALDSAFLTERGVPLDRGWALKQESSGNITGAKRYGRLLHCSARYLPDSSAGSVPHAEITLPNGDSVVTDDERVNAVLSDVVGDAVSLWPLQPAENADHYRMSRGEDADLEAEMRANFGLKPDEPLPDLSKFPEKVLAELMEFASPRGTYFDAYPLDILTMASIRRMQALLPETTFDERRFRPNILVEDDAGEVGPIEFAWVGKKLAIGEAVCMVDMQCPRCIMTTRDQPGLEEDPQIMRALVRELSQNLSVYADVEKSGLVRVGDAVAPA